ncbi:DUF2254 domain-containing protein [Ulvibacter antarcticus]|uniref:Putative membrane protein n=1 Tax=Ulvibacter antarcticus TaxID=442714 RepID=A0A3L9YDK4_9FLAO|nr:DUF2254 domain-containing protein [Ulvibacter antarcticus]RMA58544.1 putative membrane protein [Ulvibacter antarcticus]
MKYIYFKFLTFYNLIKSNIIFFPALFAIGGFNFAFLMIYLESKGLSNELLNRVPQLLVENGDTALTIISACLGGLISLMVFSFSMVMLLLSQASSNFSPRLLPGLISDKRHQVILGIYLGTIIYNIFTLFSIEPGGEKYSLPGTSVLLAIIFTIICLIAFIYFIHNMSQSIQINTILDRIYEESVDRLQHIIEIEKECDIKDDFPDTSNWNTYFSKNNGYFQNISLSAIAEICEKNSTKIYITKPRGSYLLKNVSLIKSEKELDEEILSEIHSSISFSRGELISDNYILAFKQMTEIILKAMSPGVNDPGTAINAIDYLTEIFALRMKKRDDEYYMQNETVYVKIATIKFSELLYNVMASIRTYCKHDPIIVQKLIWMLKHLYIQPALNDQYKVAVKEEVEILVKEALNTYTTEKDKTILKNLVGEF